MTRTLRITVGLDDERASTLALDWAIEQATSRSVHLTLVTAFDALLATPVDEEARLESARARIADSAPGTPVETDVANGPALATLLRYAERSDLLVIGSHRTRHYRSVLSGDLPARVARHAACPVVVVPDDWTPREGPVVVGLDDDASSRAAIRRAAEFALDSGDELRILHAWMRPQPASDPVRFYGWAPKDLRDAHARRLAQAAHVLRRRYPQLRIREDLYEGVAVNGLRILAESARLVVIGSHRRGALAGFVLGSVGRELMHSSSAPLCIVPARRGLPLGE